MRTNIVVSLSLAATIGLATGCHTNTVDKMAFKSALNNYYASHQNCLWTAPVKFPAQADASNDDQTKGFDALTDAGLLTRKAVEKKRFLIGSKQANDYDLSDKGRSTWTADTSQPGYGNFCYGHPEVTSIDGYTPADPSAAQYSVNYHYAVNLPDWASGAEIKTAFPKLTTDSAGQTATASLTKSDNGWQVAGVQPAAGAAPTAPAGQ